MSREEMARTSADVMMEGFSLGRIIKRSLFSLTHRFSKEHFASTFFTQMGMRKVYKKLQEEKLRNVIKDE
jgi:hypothetical protein